MPCPQDTDLTAIDPHGQWFMRSQALRHLANELCGGVEGDPLHRPELAEELDTAAYELECRCMEIPAKTVGGVLAQLQALLADLNVEYSSEIRAVAVPNAIATLKNLSSCGLARSSG